MKACLFSLIDIRYHQGFNALIIALMLVLFQPESQAAFNLGGIVDQVKDTVDDAKDIVDSVVNPPGGSGSQPINTVLAKPLRDFLQLPDSGLKQVVNPNNIEFNFADIKLPDFYNPDVSQIILSSDYHHYWSLLPEVLEKAIPLIFDETYEFENILNLSEFWFVFYTNGSFYIDIEITSQITWLYDVLNQEGTSIPLNETGGLNPGMAPGFYYIRVVNPAKSDTGIVFPFAKSSFLENGFSIRITARAGEGGIVEGRVISICDEQPIARASVSIATDFRYTHTDGRYQFISKTATDQAVQVYAEGYQSNRAIVKVYDVSVTQLDFDLSPMQSCDPSLTAETPDERAKQFQEKPIYDDEHEIVYFSHVKAEGFPEGVKHFTAQLSRVDDQSGQFKVAELKEINTEKQNVTALYNAEKANLIIPEVIAFGKRYAVELKHDANYLFSIVKAEELE